MHVKDCMRNECQALGKAVRLGTSDIDLLNIKILAVVMAPIFLAGSYSLARCFAAKACVISLCATWISDYLCRGLYGRIPPGLHLGRV